MDLEGGGGGVGRALGGTGLRWLSLSGFVLPFFLTYALSIRNVLFESNTILFQSLQ
jgi:hypothetical protein